MTDTQRRCRLLTLVLAMLLPACGREPGAPAPVAASPADRPSPTVSPSPAPTSTATHTSTATATLTPTPTPPVISSEVIGRLEILGQVEQGAARAVAWSPDGSLLATGVGRRVFLQQSIDPARRTVLRCDSEVYSLALSPDGQMLAVGEGSVVSLWEVTSGTRVHTFHLVDLVRSVAFNPQGGMLAAAGYDRQIHLWSSDGFASLGTLQGHEDWILGIAFSSDGQFLASASMDGEVRLWDLARNALLQTLDAHGNGAYCVAFDPVAGTLASGGGDGLIQVWDPATGELLRTIQARSGVVLALSFSPGGEQLAWSGLDGRIRVLDLDQGAEPLELEGHRGLAYHLSFAPGGEWLASAGSDGSALVWRLEDGEAAWEAGYGFPDDSFAGMAFSEDGSLVTGSTAWNSTRFYRWDSRLVHRELLGFGPFFSFAFALAPDDSLLALATNEGIVLIQPGSADPPVFWPQGDMPYRLTFSDDGEMLAWAAFPAESIAIREIGSAMGIPIGDHGCSQGGCNLAFLPGTHTLATAGSAGLQFWEDPTRASGRTLLDTPVREVAFTPDGSIVAALGEDWTLYILGLPDGELLHALSTDGSSQSVSLDPSGALVALANGVGEVVIWDTHTRTILRTLRIPGEHISQVTFDSSGWHLATYSWRLEGSTLRWTLTSWGIAEGVSQ